MVLLLFLLDEARQIAPVSELHEYAEGATELFEEGRLVADDVGGVDRGEESDFVECIILFSCVELHHFDLFHGVYLVLALMAANFDHLSEASRA